MPTATVRIPEHKRDVRKGKHHLYKCIPELLDKVGKGGRGKGNKKGKKGNGSDQLPFPIEGGEIIYWRWMPESKEDEKGKQENPSRIIKNSNEGHSGSGREVDNPTPPPKKGIGNMTSIELSDR